MKYWSAYTKLINRNCMAPGKELRDLSYWRDSLFARIIIFALPSCLFALLPSLYMIIVIGKPIMAFADLSALGCMLLIALVPGVGITARKITFISCIYLLACFLLYFLGIHGSGLLYLFAACIFSIFILQTLRTFWSAFLNTLICFFFGIAKYHHAVPWPDDRDNSLGAWIAVSANLVFLSFLSTALLTKVFNGLQDTIDKEKKLTEELTSQQESLQGALDMVEQKNIELEQFAYVASHDLKEPVRMVSSFMGLLKNKYGSQLDEKAHSYIDFAIDGGKRMQRMIGDLLGLSRTARTEAVMEWVDIGALLEEVEQNIYRQIEESGAEIAKKTKLPVIAVCRADVVRLFQNLLSNAIKFRKPGKAPVILVGATENAEDWLFTIEDNGIGIDPEKREKIFEIFSRLHTQENYEGTGIGLAVCKKVVEHHGGKIWVRPSESGGSRFFFIIKK